MRREGTPTERLQPRAPTFGCMYIEYLDAILGPSVSFSSVLGFVYLDAYGA